MRFTSAAVAAFLLSVTGVASFSTQKPAFVVSRTSAVASSVSTSSKAHSAGCACASCLGRALHPAGCTCGACSGTALFSTAESATEEEVPAEVAALDGIADEDEAHNAERPARKSLKKKGPKGKPLSEFAVGDTVAARVKSIASYGAFLDFGAQTDGLLHISQLSVGYVADVKSVLEVNQEVEVRILSIDEKKNQVALSLLSKAEEQESSEASNRNKQQRDNRPARKDDSAVLKQLSDKGWSPEQFVEGTVVSTVDFGAFVRVDVSQLNPEVEGEIDGLVHISALTPGRAASVTSVVSVDQKVQVRVKAIAKNKVSLSMISVEDEQAAAERFGGGSAPEPQGNKEWKKAVEELQEAGPKFENRPVVVDMRS